MTEGKIPARILIVDDEEIMRSFLADVLTDEGYETDIADNGEQGIEKIKEGQFQLVITDVKMPGVSGIDVLKAAKDIDKNIDVIIMTGYASVNTAVESMKLGAVDYITKPFNIDQIKMIVERTIEKRRMTRQIEEGKFYRELVSTDVLTDLYNHKYFQQLLESEISRALSHKRNLSVIMIDVDDFSSYNEIVGYAAGDLVLKEISWIFKKHTETSHHIARFSGQKFAIIIPEWEKEEVRKLASELRTIIEETKFEHEEKLPRGKVTVSIGLVFYPQDGENRKDLLEHLKDALLRAKKSGGNCVRVYEE
ncbi:MAG: diguanylate cyclase [Candidatus Aureabacteria bacterium]|nr:diguanylate cyclase [Candidatus Auribacterota bacterium]